MSTSIRIGILFIFLVGASQAFAAGVRVQLEEILFQIDAHGNSHPVDHQVIDVFALNFENQYGSVEKASPNGRYGASYFEVPAANGGHVNHNVYCYVGDGPFLAITDGYHNGQVPGAKFKITVMTTRRVDDKVRVRTMHVIDPPAAGSTVVSSAALRQLTAKVDALVAAAR